ncbi:SPOR domain-containing protein [Formosa maritima]|uniref:SPOR domain-containing protein n=1 Tax=Formosa maritima TaxID=2592046 RepID=A0A5D0GBP5_9FLAO|nr:SPOR domain-containing protein [Formosa maritima]TYA55192.1 SPOR domain-containing protein [Formosa maritima]
MKISTFTVICILFFSNLSIAQQGTLTINQDKDIDKLLTIKKEMNESENTSDRYRIQIYSGNRSEAEKTKSTFKSLDIDLPSKLVYETPNYKVWVGNFRDRLEADRALKKVKEKFPVAFIFKPKKEKDL